MPRRGTQAQKDLKDSSGRKHQTRRGRGSVAKHFHVMAHEGMHATTGSLVGIPIRGIILKRNGEGETQFRVPAVGGRLFVTGFVGYLGPSAFGLAAAGLISLGYIIAVLWLAAAFLVILLLKLIRSFGHITVPVAMALFFVFMGYTSVRVQVVMAYCVTWVLLLSGVRAAWMHGANAADAAVLTRQTRLPRSLWALLWIAGALGAVYVGSRLLVLRALCRVMEYLQVGQGRDRRALPSTASPPRDRLGCGRGAVHG